MHFVNAVRLIVAVLVGALLGGVLGGWIGIPFGAVVVPLLVLTVTVVRRQRRRIKAT